MRHIALVAFVISLSLASTEALAKGTVMGGFTCRQPLPCDQSDSAFPSTDQLLSLANACVAQNTVPLSTTTSFFNDSQGVDKSGCFSTNSAAFPGKDGLRSIPECCVTQAPSGVCFVHCDLISQ